MISKLAKIGKNVKIGHGVIIKDDVIIGDNVIIDDYVRVLDGVEIGKNSYIGAFVTLGEIGVNYATPKYSKTKIGDNALIRSYTVMYHSNNIGNNFQTGHRVTIREKTEIGNNVRIGTLSDIQGYCKMGNYVNLHSNVHIGQKSIIEDFVWIFPYVVLTNDPTPPSEKMQGVIVKKYAVIATASIILPGVTIGEDTLVGAKTLVNKDVNENTIVVGNPMKIVGNIGKIKNKETGEQVYPWRYKFDRGMPWQGKTYEEWAKNN